MKRKFTLTAIIISICIITSGCFGNSKEMKEIEEVQNTLLNINSGHIVVLSSIENDEKMEHSRSDFTYRINEKGFMEYCQMQMDRTNKLVFCEMNDSEFTEQWILGKGWSSVDSKKYSQKNPHQYLGILTQKLKNIDSIEKEKDITNCVYTIKLNCSDEIKEETIALLVGEDNNLLCYTDTAIVDENGIDTKYTLEMQLTEHNAITEIKKPDLAVSASMVEDDGMK